MFRIGAKQKYIIITCKKTPHERRHKFFLFLCEKRPMYTRNCLLSFTFRPVTMATRSFSKKLELQLYPPNNFCTDRYKNKSSKKPFKLVNRKKRSLGRSWAKIGLRKSQRKVSSNRRDSESSTDIDRQNQGLRHEI